MAHRSAGEGEGAAQGLLASAAAAAARARSPLRSRSSPESSHSGGSSDGGAVDEAAVARAPVGHLVLGRVAAAAGAGLGGGVSSFMLAPSRLPAVPSALPLTGSTLPFGSRVQAAANDVDELSTLPAVDQAEPPGRLPIAAQHAQQPPQRQLPPLSPTSSPQLHRNASSSSESRGVASRCMPPHALLKCSACVHTEIAVYTLTTTASI